MLFIGMNLIRVYLPLTKKPFSKVFFQTYVTGSVFSDLRNRLLNLFNPNEFELAGDFW